MDSKRLFKGLKLISSLIYSINISEVYIFNFLTFIPLNTQTGKDKENWRHGRVCDKMQHLSFL